MPRVIKLSVAALQKIIAEEKGKLGPIGDVTKEPKKTKEVNADEYAGTLEKEIDHLKAMKVKEASMIKDLKKLREEMKLRASKINEAKSKRVAKAGKRS